MKKYITIVIRTLIIATMVGGCMVLLGKGKVGYHRIVETIKYSDFDFYQANLLGQGVIFQEEKTVKDLENELELVRNIVDLPGEWKIQTIGMKDQKSIWGRLENNDLEIDIRMVSNLYKELWNTYLHIELSIKEDDFLVEDYIAIINKIFCLYKEMPEISLVVQGKLQGKLEESSLEKLGEEFLKGLKAKNKQTYYSKNIYSIYGYTKTISNYYRTLGNKNKMNINIVFRYQEVDNTTLLYLATPLMDQPY